MDQSRRNFLKNGLLLVGGAMVAPSCVMLRAPADTVRHYTRNMHMGYMQQIDGDALSEDHYLKGEDSLISESLRRMKEFYSDTVDIKMCGDVFDESTPKSIDFIFNYVTPEKFTERLVENNPHVIQLINDEEIELNVDKLGEALKKYNSDDRHFAAILDIVNRKNPALMKDLEACGCSYKEYVNSEVARRLGNEIRYTGGVCTRQNSDSGAGMLYMTARAAFNRADLTKPAIRERALKILEYTDVHQMGHLLGLDHPTEKDNLQVQYNNVMYHPLWEEFYDYKNYAITMNPSIADAQKGVIRNYLKTGIYTV